MSFYKIVCSSHCSVVFKGFSENVNFTFLKKGSQKEKHINHRCRKYFPSGGQKWIFPGVATSGEISPTRNQEKNIFVLKN